MKSEFDFIKDLADLFRSSDPKVRTGIGDDCAVLRVGSEELLLTVDAFIEDVHFRRDFTSPEALGHKAAAVSLSDVAAMGGEPLALLVTAAFPRDTAHDFAAKIAAGIQIAADDAGARVIGGDTTRSPGPLVLDVIAVGRVPHGGRAVLRTGAREGDLVAVTGTPGDSGLGLSSILGRLDLKGAARDYAQARHGCPMPRWREGLLLGASPAVHAMIDVSDGVGQDLAHLARAAGLTAVLDETAFPCSPPIESFRDSALSIWQDHVLSGGEDYELLVALAPDGFDMLERRIAAETGTRFTAIGRFGPRGDAPVVLSDGRAPDLSGYDHFR